MSDEKPKSKSPSEKPQYRTTGLLLSLLLGGRAAAASVGKSPSVVDDLKLGPHAPPLTPFEDTHALIDYTQTTYLSPDDLAFQSPQDICPRIDDAFLAKLIVRGTKKESKLLLDALKTLYKSHPQVKQHLEQIVSYLPGFGINIYSAEGMKLRGYSESFVAAFSASTKILAFRGDKLLGWEKEKHRTMEFLAHELRHTLLNTVQRLLLKYPTPSLQCHFPDTATEKAAIKNMIDKGNKRLENLKKMLQQEKEGTISSKNKDKLNKLRKDSEREFVLMHGKGDPLIASVETYIPAFQKAISQYHKEEQAYELDAYLFSAVPEAIRKYIFSEFIDHINQLITKAFSQAEPAPYSSSAPPYFTVDQHQDQHFLMLTDSKLLAEAHSNLIASILDQLLKRKEPQIDAAKNAIDELIKRNDLDSNNLSNLRGLYLTAVYTTHAHPAYLRRDFVTAKAGFAECIRLGQGQNAGFLHLMVANCEYYSGNYKKAVKHYKLAKENKGIFSAEEEANYKTAQALKNKPKKQDAPDKKNSKLKMFDGHEKSSKPATSSSESEVEKDKALAPK